MGSRLNRVEDLAWCEWIIRMRTSVQAQVKHALTRGQPLPRRGHQQLHLNVIVSRADVLDIP